MRVHSCELLTVRSVYRKFTAVNFGPQLASCCGETGRGERAVCALAVPSAILLMMPVTLQEGDACGPGVRSTHRGAGQGAWSAMCSTGRRDSACDMAEIAVGGESRFRTVVVDITGRV